MNGWVKLHRKIRFSAVMRDDFLCRLWIWCMIMARHSDQENLGRGIVCAGSFITDRESGSRELNVHPFKFYRALKCLETARQIDLKPHNKKTLVTIVNWGIYQGSETEDAEDLHSKCTDNAQQMHNKCTVVLEKNGKNGKKKEPPQAADGFFSNGFQEITPFTSPEFAAAWSEWSKCHAENHRPLKPATIRAQYAKLAIMGESRAIAALRHSTAGSFKNIYEPPTTKGPPAKPPESQQQLAARIAKKRRIEAEEEQRLAADRAKNLELLDQLKLK